MPRWKTITEVAFVFSPGRDQQHDRDGSAGDGQPQDRHQARKGRTVSGRETRLPVVQYGICYAFFESVAEAVRNIP